MVIPNGNRSDVPLGTDPYVHLRRAPEGVIVEGEPSWDSAGPTGNRLRGEAPSAGWKVSGDRITIECDRLGVHPLFIWCDRSRIAVSPSIPRLLRLGAPRDMDFPAFAAFLRMGFFLGNDTPFAAIRAVPGGTHRLELGSEFMAREDRLPGVEPSRLGRDAAIDRYIELFRAAIESGIAAADRIVLPLSGGRDSRHILLEMLEQGRPPDLCVTATYYPPRPDVDREVRWVSAPPSWRLCAGTSVRPGSAR